jgi:hypothetical protein
MAFKVFGKRKNDRRYEADPIEMGPVREEPPRDPTPPGEPVPYDASLYLQKDGDDGSVYRRGAADMLSPKEAKREREMSVAPEPEEEVHVLQVPDQVAPPPAPSIVCPGCGSSMTMPWGRPVVVTCSKCGTTRTIR